MTTTLTPFQANGLRKLASIKAKVDPDKASKGANTSTVFSELTQIICEHQLADSDYSTLPQQRVKFKDDKEWLDQFTLSGVCKYFTYLIWTESVVTGHFDTRIQDKSVYLVLSKLESLLE